MPPNNTHVPLPPTHHKKPPFTHKVKEKLRKTPLWLSILLAVAGVVLAICIIVLLWFISIVYAVRTDVSVNGEVFVVKPNTGIHEIAQSLANQNLISDSAVFEIYTKLGPAHGKLIPGPYLIRPSSSIASIVSDMSAGRIAQNKITYPEGITIASMAKRFAAAGYGTEAEYMAAVVQLAPNYNFIPPSSLANPEGYLFPSTYTFVPGSGATELVRKQYETFQSQMLPLLQGAKPAGLTDTQVLTLASIVEREALTDADRRMVAGVFINRLRLGMKFESDVTVNYATGKTTTSAADTQVSSPYNTYKIVGLPPTPINNPSTDSVEAVLHYTPNDYIFFIAGNDGKLYYAKTLQEHNANIQNHL
jgi:UPF0755 protein